jgi:hypothetical protein
MALLRAILDQRRTSYTLSVTQLPSWEARIHDTQQFHNPSPRGSCVCAVAPGQPASRR